MRSGGFNTPQLAAESVSKACFGVHTRDFQSFPFNSVLLNILNLGKILENL
jgi:hypothetical protein